MDEDYVLISSHAEGTETERTGRTYLFDARTGRLLRELTAPRAGANEYFGGPVAGLVGKPVVSAILYAPGQSGAVFVFDVPVATDMPNPPQPGARAGE